MLALLFHSLFLAVAPTNAAPDPSPDTQEIVVIGERIKRIKVATKQDRKSKAVRCIVKRSSGDRQFDIAFCEAVAACATKAVKAADMERCMGPKIEAMAGRATARPDALH